MISGQKEGPESIGLSLPLIQNYVEGVKITPSSDLGRLAFEDPQKAIATIDETLNDFKSTNEALNAIRSHLSVVAEVLKAKRKQLLECQGEAKKNFHKIEAQRIRLLKIWTKGSNKPINRSKEKIQLEIKTPQPFEDLTRKRDHEKKRNMLWFSENHSTMKENVKPEERTTTNVKLKIEPFIKPGPPLSNEVKNHLLGFRKIQDQLKPLTRWDQEQTNLLDFGMQKKKRTEKSNTPWTYALDKL